MYIRTFNRIKHIYDIYNLTHNRSSWLRIYSILTSICKLFTTQSLKLHSICSWRCLFCVDDVIMSCNDDSDTQVVDSPAEVAEKADRIFTMLPSSPNVIEVYTGPNGILKWATILSQACDICDIHTTSLYRLKKKCKVFNVQTERFGQTNVIVCTLQVLMLFVSPSLGRWRRERCWSTPPPSTLPSQERWQSLQRRWAPCSWTLQCQEVMRHPKIESPSLHVWFCDSV